MEQAPTSTITILVGVLTMILIPLVSYLFARNQHTQDELIKQNAENQTIMKDIYDKEFKEVDDKIANLNEKINVINVEILKELGQIGIKIAEFKSRL